MQHPPGQMANKAINPVWILHVIKSREMCFSPLYLSDIISVISNKSRGYRAQRKVEAFESLLFHFKSRRCRFCVQAVVTYETKT